jgi:hypothetical protein
VRVDQTQGAELTPNIYQLVGNTNFGGWVIQSNTTVTSNTTETLSPDGTNNATKMTSNGSEGLYIPSLGTASLNTKSIFLKGVSGGEQVILQDPHQNIDPLTCTLTTEWQRFHLTQTQTGSFGLWLTNIPSGGIYAYGPQVQVLGLTDFVENTTGSPKFITGATYSPRVPMILVEPSATNLLTYSEDFSQWSNSRTTETTNATLSPDGATNGTYLEQEAGNTNAGSIFKTFSSVSGSVTLSVYAKAKEKKFVVLYDTNVGRTYFNLESGTVGTVPSGNTAKIEEAGNGWFRCSTTITASSGVISAFYVGDSDNSSVVTGGGGVYIWGAQLETGSVATSYIPSLLGSTVTRAKDDLVISGSAFSSFYNASEGTTYMEAVPNSSSNAPTFFEYFDASDASNQIMGSYISGSTISYYVKTNGSFVAIHSIGNVNLNQLNRIAVSYKTNDILGSLNGATEVADTSAALPTGIDKVSLGNDNSGNFSITGRIRRLIYWPTNSDNL